MRWLLVLAVLVVAVVAVLTLRSSGARDRAVPVGEAPADPEAPAPRAEELEVAPTAVLAPVEVPHEPARSELADETPRVRGVVRAEDGQPLGEEVTLEVDVYAASGVRPRKLDAPVASDGRFDFTVPAGTSYVTLDLRAEGLHTPTEVRVLPGEEVVVVALRHVPEVALPQDLVVAGVVLDQDVQPFEGVSVCAIEPDSVSWRLGENRTGADGRFELTGLARRRWRIVAQSGESFGNVHQDIDGTRGDVHDLVLTLVRGGCIAGTVRWPDGRVVEEFEAKAATKGRSRNSNFFGGKFELRGLDQDTKWTIEVTARDGEIAGTAQVAAVRPGGPALELVLETDVTFGVELHVRDSQGAPVVDFSVWANASERRAKVGGDGKVVLEGLTAGEWRFHVSAPGYEDQTRSILLTPGDGPLVFELSAEGRVRGRVVDAEGRAVAGADVFAETRWDNERHDTDQEGRFELSAPSGEARVRARLVGAGISDPVAIVVTSGETTKGIVLTLGAAARLEGRVLDATGQPASGVNVHVQIGWDNTTTAADGSFLLEGLAPGATRIFASDIEGHGQVEAPVELFRGQTSTIELRFLARDPVRVRGRATLAGSPYTGSLGFHGMAAWGHAECDREGRFTVELDRPGTWTCWRSDDADSAGLHALDLLIPDVDEHELTLDLDTMRPLESFDELR